MAGIGSYEKGKKFTLKSGNTTPFKKMGSSPLKQDYVKDRYHEKYNPTGTKGKLTSAQIQDKAVEKLMTDKNISRKAFDTKLAKITKTVDPHASQGVKKGLQSKPPKASTRYYDPIAKTKLAKFTPKSITPKSLAKGALRIAGEALMAYDVLKEGVKRVTKGVKTGKPQTKLKGDWKRAPKKKYIK